MNGHAPVATVTGADVPGKQPAKTGSGVTEPARLLSMAVKAAPLSSVVAALSERTGWAVSLGRELGERRVTAQLQRVTPGQVLEALTLLANARQQVAIGQSEEQRRQEEQLAAQAADHRSERGKLSDALKEDLLKALTPEQSAQLANGQPVQLGVSSLPPTLRDRALQFIQFSSDDLRQHLPTFPAPNTTRFGDFSLEIIPAPGSGVSIIGVDESGGRIQY